MLYFISLMPLSYTLNVYKGRKFQFIIRKKFITGNQVFIWGQRMAQIICYIFSWVIWFGKSRGKTQISPLSSQSFLSFSLLGFQFVMFLASDLCFVEVEVEMCEWGICWDFKSFRMWRKNDFPVPVSRWNI